MKPMVVYSQENPPACIADATHRLSEVQASIKLIKGSLGKSGDRSYSSWRDLLDRQKKKEEIVETLRRAEVENEFLSELVSQDQFQDVFKEVGLSTDFLAEGSVLARKYSQEAIPPDVKAGRERRDECVELKRRCDVCLAILPSTALERKDVGIDCTNAYFSLRARIITAKARLEDELGFLKRWNEQQTATAVLNGEGLQSPTAQIRALIAIIKRMRDSGGVRLAENELAVMNAIEHNLQVGM